MSRFGSPESGAVYSATDFVKRVADSLLRGQRRGMVFCARCLVKLTKENLDKSYLKAEIIGAIDEMFDSPGSLTRLPVWPCAGCRRKAAGLGFAPPQPQ